MNQGHHLNPGPPLKWCCLRLQAGVGCIIDMIVWCVLTIQGGLEVTVSGVIPLVQFHLHECPIGMLVTRIKNLHPFQSQFYLFYERFTNRFDRAYEGVHICISHLMD